MSELVYKGPKEEKPKTSGFAYYLLLVAHRQFLTLLSSVVGYLASLG